VYKISLKIVVGVKDLAENIVTVDKTIEANFSTVRHLFGS